MGLRGLRLARQRRGYSISQLAAITGLRRETITELEHGRAEPQPYALARLATALATAPAELYGARPAATIAGPPYVPPPSRRPAPHP